MIVPPVCEPHPLGALAVEIALVDQQIRTHHQQPPPSLDLQPHHNVPLPSPTISVGPTGSVSSSSTDPDANDDVKMRSRVDGPLTTEHHSYTSDEDMQEDKSDVHGEEIVIDEVTAVEQDGCEEQDALSRDKITLSKPLQTIVNTARARRVKVVGNRQSPSAVTFDPMDDRPVQPQWPKDHKRKRSEIVKKEKPRANAGDKFICPCCQQMYALSSRRTIKRHVVECAKVKHPSWAECDHGEIASRLEKQAGLAALKGFVFRKQKAKRDGANLPFNHRWYCPWENRGCPIFFAATSTNSKLRHQESCMYQRAPVQFDREQMEARKRHQKQEWQVRAVDLEKEGHVEVKREKKSKNCVLPKNESACATSSSSYCAASATSLSACASSSSAPHMTLVPATVVVMSEALKSRRQCTSREKFRGRLMEEVKGIEWQAHQATEGCVALAMKYSSTATVASGALARDRKKVNSAGTSPIVMHVDNEEEEEEHEEDAEDGSQSEQEPSTKKAKQNHPSSASGLNLLFDSLVAQQQQQLYELKHMHHMDFIGPQHGQLSFRRQPHPFVRQMDSYANYMNLDVVSSCFPPRSRRSSLTATSTSQQQCVTATSTGFQLNHTNPSSDTPLSVPQDTTLFLKAQACAAKSTSAKNGLAVHAAPTITNSSEPPAAAAPAQFLKGSILPIAPLTIPRDSTLEQLLLQIQPDQRLAYEAPDSAGMVPSRSQRMIHRASVVTTASTQKESPSISAITDTPHMQAQETEQLNWPTSGSASTVSPLQGEWVPHGCSSFSPHVLHNNHVPSIHSTTPLLVPYLTPIGSTMSHRKQLAGMPFILDHSVLSQRVASELELQQLAERKFALEMQLQHQQRCVLMLQQRQLEQQYLADISVLSSPSVQLTTPPLSTLSCPTTREIPYLAGWDPTNEFSSVPAAAVTVLEDNQLSHSIQVDFVPSSPSLSAEQDLIRTSVDHMGMYSPDPLFAHSVFMSPLRITRLPGSAMLNSDSPCVPSRSLMQSESPRVTPVDPLDEIQGRQETIQGFLSQQQCGSQATPTTCVLRRNDA